MIRFVPALFCVATFSAAILASSAPAFAESRDVSPASFVIGLQQEVNAKPADVFEDIAKVDKWWNKKHTWSGDANNLSMQLSPGGCFCERWDANFVEHGRVIGVRKDSMVRLESSLGPLQELAVTGILTFTVLPKEGKTTLKISYRVNGGPQSGLDKWAAPVESVLTEQMHRLALYAEKGDPE